MYSIFKLFTTDQSILALIPLLLIVSLFRETGRTANIVVIPGLKGAGDVQFPVIVGMISMWGVAAGGGILLGKFFGLGLLGIWIGIAADELIRGLVMLGRWKSGRWISKRMVDDDELATETA